MNVTIKAKLVAKRDDMYSDLVFENLDEVNDSWVKYLTVTKLPHWQASCPSTNIEGFLTYEVAKAGEKYYKPDLDVWETYKNDGFYFISFVSLADPTSGRQEYTF